MMRSVGFRSIAAAGLSWLAAVGMGVAAPVEISSLEELAAHAAGDGREVVMKPGVYALSDFLTPEMVRERRARKEYPFMVFSGSGNTFVMEGVTLELDTALRAALRPPVHTYEFVITGDGNTLRGLTLTTIGEGSSPGGGVVSIRGRGNTLQDCEIHVGGSFPYGYGDLFGKGGPGVIGHRKHSGVHIAGDGTRVIGCRLFMRAFGHGYFVQEDAADVLIEDCLVEGEMRATDEMLAETSGPAFDVDFRTVLKNRAGEHRVVPGYMKSLAEDGFRTYGHHRNLVIRNCTAKHMRAGFELRSESGVRLENCAAIGCERGFWISTGAVVENCRGDARHGPLLFLEGRDTRVDLMLMPDASDRTVHALATLWGSGHRVSIRPAEGLERVPPLPILLGSGAPPAGEGMAPYSEKPARRICLSNHTAMPVVIGASAEDCEIETRGEVAANEGRGAVIRLLDP
jgi:hypothetical protein